MNYCIYIHIREILSKFREYMRVQVCHKVIHAAATRSRLTRQLYLVPLVTVGQHTLTQIQLAARVGAVEEQLEYMQY